MAFIYLSLKEIWKLEFSDNPDKFLHQNATEEYLTLGGVYEKANPHGIDWKFVKGLTDVCNNDMKRASRMLYFDTKTIDNVKDVYRNNYWNPLKLDEVESQKIADEIFAMAVVSGVKTSAKIAQRLIGVKDDGIIGNQTLNALNNFDENIFDVQFDEEEIKHFKSLVKNSSKFSIYLNGWKSRAVLV